MGAGQLVKEIIKKLREHGHSDENIASRVFGFSNNAFDLRYGLNRHKLIGHFEVANFLEVKMSKTFDVIIGNPPYAGTQQLHQQFFNSCVSSFLIDNGWLVFIQPATSYLNKKDNKKGHDAQMAEHIVSHKTDAKFVGYDVFEGAAGGAGSLVISTLHKVPNPGRKIQSCEYRDGFVQYDVAIEDINMLALDSVRYNQIKAKYINAVKKMGSLSDIAAYRPLGENVVFVPYNTGSFGEDRYYSIVTKDMPGFWETVGAKHTTYWSLALKDTERSSFMSFAETFVARFGLVFLKYNQQNARGEYKTVPLVPFDRHWTDEALAELIGLTAEELDVIRNTLPDYHGLLKGN